MDGFSLQHITGGETGSQIYAFKVSISVWLHRMLLHQMAMSALPCCVGWNHSYLILSLAVLGGEQSGMEGGNAKGCGRRDTAEGKRGGVVVLGFRDCRHLYSSLISGGGEKGGKAWRQCTAGDLAGLWQRLRNQRCNVTRSYHHCSRLGLCRYGGTKIINGICCCREKSSKRDIYISYISINNYNKDIYIYILYKYNKWFCTWHFLLKYK